MPGPRLGSSLEHFVFFFFFVIKGLLGLERKSERLFFLERREGRKDLEAFLEVGWLVRWWVT